MKTYLFDFDGTLVDSMPYYCRAMLRILDEHHVPYGDDIIKIITPLGSAGTVRYFQSISDAPMQPEIIQKVMADLVQDYANVIPAKEGVMETLRTLKAQSASLNILTASPHATLDPCAKRVGLWDICDNVWSCDDFGTSKADPEIYRMAAQRLGAKVQDVLFLDDNCNADRTAKAAGMPVCGVYDASSADYEEEMRSICDFYIRDFKELLSI